MWGWCLLILAVAVAGKVGGVLAATGRAVAGVAGPPGRTARSGGTGDGGGPGTPVRLSGL
jgi:hypothetical protein